jgi:hypothetical protein
MVDAESTRGCSVWKLCSVGCTGEDGPRERQWQTTNDTHPTDLWIDPRSQLLAFWLRWTHRRLFTSGSLELGALTHLFLASVTVALGTTGVGVHCARVCFDTDRKTLIPPCATRFGIRHLFPRRERETSTWVRHHYIPTTTAINHWRTDSAGVVLDWEAFFTTGVEEERLFLVQF